jgi:hypothetical protein
MVLLGTGMTYTILVQAPTTAAVAVPAMTAVVLQINSSKENLTEAVAVEQV